MWSSKNFSGSGGIVVSLVVSQTLVHLKMSNFLALFATLFFTDIIITMIKFSNLIGYFILNRTVK